MEDYNKKRQEKLTKLLMGEKELARPKAGELWRYKYDGGYATIFWTERPLPSHRAQVKVNNREIIMTLATEYDDSRYIEGVEVRWTMRAIIGGRAAYRKYTSLTRWHKFFERVR